MSKPIAETYNEYVATFQQRIVLMFTDKPAYWAKIKTGLESKGAIQIAEKINLASGGLNFFSEELLEGLIWNNGLMPMVSHMIWERLVLARIVIKEFGHMSNVFVDHVIDTGVLAKHIVDDTLENIFHPPHALIKRYSGALVAVDVLKNGDVRRGSGFIVRRDRKDDVVENYIVTCKHNVDPNDGIAVKQVTTSLGVDLGIGPWLLSDRYDVAIARLNASAVSPVFRLRDTVNVFDQVFTLGFPNVPGAHSILLGHRGELNGRADLYLAKCPALLISNLVSPGSSGCPVLDEAGRCAGMTMRWIEGEWDDEKMRFSAAIPSKLLEAELEELAK